MSTIFIFCMINWLKMSSVEQKKICEVCSWFFFLRNLSNSLRITVGIPTAEAGWISGELRCNKQSVTFKKLHSAVNTTEIREWEERFVHFKLVFSRSLVFLKCCYQQKRRSAQFYGLIFRCTTRHKIKRKRERPRVCGDAHWVWGEKYSITVVILWVPVCLL